MKYTRVFVEAIAYELPPLVVDTADIEQRLAPAYAALSIPPGQIEPLTGVRQRRIWEPGFPMWEGAARAARKALERTAIPAAAVGMLAYGAVCRDQLEPATACAVADNLGLAPTVEIYDVSNACLGVLNGMIQAANAIELGAVRAALVVSCESSRQIVDMTIDRMNRESSPEVFRKSLATMTGGSGAVAVLLAAESVASPAAHRLHTATIRSAPKHHRLCRWGPDTGIPATLPMLMETDASAVLQHGVALGTETWAQFLTDTGWSATTIDRVICHQVGAGHRLAILESMGLSPDKDFSTFPFLGNIGTVSLPITAAIAEERGFLTRGNRVGFLGIGSGLNCLMLGLDW